MTGYAGRMGVYQLVEVTPDLQDQIVKGATLNEMRQQVEDGGARTLLQDGLIKASNGLTTIDELYRVMSVGET